MQATSRASNSAVTSLPASKPCQNSAAGQVGRIIPKRLIFWRFLTLRGCLLRERGVFLPAVREPRQNEAQRPLRRAGAGHAVRGVEPDAAEAAEELGQGQPVGERQWRGQQRGD